jgi:hypothetical protein
MDFKHLHFSYKKQSCKLIHQPADFSLQFILSLRTTPSGEALLRVNRSKLYEIAALRSRRSLASGCSAHDFQRNYHRNKVAYMEWISKRKRVYNLEQ